MHKKIFNIDWWFVVFVLFVAATQFSVKSIDYEERVVDFQVIFRLGFYVFLLFLFSGGLNKFALDFIKTYQLLFIFFIYVVFDAVVSLSFYSVYAIFTNVMVLFFVYSFYKRVGDRLYCYYYRSVVIFCGIGLFYYYFDPEIGRYSYWSDGLFFQSTRMQGVSGHPNTLGFMISSALICCFALRERFRLFSLRNVGIGFLFFCLVLANSRTNLVALIFFAGWVYFSNKKLLALYLTGLPVVLLFSALFIYIAPEFVNSLFSMFSRTGDVNEIFTFTGRADIWDFVVSLFFEKPIFGWGYGTISSVLSINSDQVGFIVGQTHSLYLQMLLASGIVGSLIFFVFYIRAVISLNSRRSYVNVSLLLMILFVGFSEAIIFNTIANNAFIVFALAIFGVDFEINYASKSEISIKRISRN